MAFFTDSWRGGGVGRGAYVLNSNNVAQIPLTLQLIAAQVANGFEIKNSAGTVVFSVSPSGDVTYLGDETISDSLTVNGNIVGHGTLTIDGVTTLSGATLVNDTLYVSALATFDGGIAVTGNSTIEGTTTIHTLFVEGDLALNSGYIRSRYSANLYLYPSPSTITVVGATNATSHTLNTNSDMFINGKLEVDGAIFADGGLGLGDDDYLYFGDSNDVGIGWNTAQTVDGWYFGTATGQNTMIIAEIGDIAYDFAHGAKIDPTVFIHSHNQSTAEWGSFSHDTTSFNINSGYGNITLTPIANSFVNVYSTDTSTIGGPDYGLYVTKSSSAVVTGVNQDLYGTYSSVSKIGADTSPNVTSLYGVYGIATNTGATNAGTKNTYGGYFSATGDSAGTSTTYGIYVSASGADVNYAGYFVNLGTVTPIYMQGTVNSYCQFEATNKSNGALASTDIVAMADNGTETTNFIDLGINSSGNTDAAFTIAAALDGYLYTSDTDLCVGTANAAKSLKFFTGGTLAANLRTTINQLGAMTHSAKTSADGSLTGITSDVQSTGATGDNDTIRSFLNAGTYNFAGNTLAAYTGYHVANATLTAGTMTRQYGIFIDSLTVGSSNFGIYINTISGGQAIWSAENTYYFYAAAAGQFVIDAAHTDHTGTSVLYMPVDNNSCNLDSISILNRVTVALSAGEVFNGIKIDADGIAGDNASGQVNGITLTTTNATGGISTMIVSSGSNWDYLLRTAANLSISETTLACTWQKTASVDNSINALIVDVQSTGATGNNDSLTALKLTGTYNFAANTLQTYYGLYITNVTKTAGTITGQYGIYLDAMSGAGTNYGIFSNNNAYIFYTGAGQQFVIDGSSAAHTDPNGVLSVTCTTLTNLVKTLNLTTTLTATTGKTQYGLYNTVADSTVKTGTDHISYGIYSTNTKTGADTSVNTNYIYGAYVTGVQTGSTDAGTRNTYGMYAGALGDTAGTSTAYGGYYYASGADTNYGLYSYQIATAGTANYGLYLGAISGAASNYAIYTNAGTVRFGGAVTISPEAAASGTPMALTITGAANTGMTASTEVIGVNFNLSATKQWATGACGFQREFVIQAPTYAFVGGSNLGFASTLFIDGSPIEGVNATIEASIALAIGKTSGTTVSAAETTVHQLIAMPGITNGTGTVTARVGTHVTGNIDDSAVLLGDQTATLSTLVGLAVTPGVFESTTLVRTVTFGFGAAIEPPESGSARVRFGDVGSLALGTTTTIYPASAATTYSELMSGGEVVTLSAATQLTGAPAFANIMVYANTIGQSAGATIVDNAASIYIEGTHIAGGDITITNNYALWIDSGASRFDGAIIGNQGTDIASASTIVITKTGNVFELTGVTKVNLITATGWQDGTEITLIANENVTIDHGTATSGSDVTILLAGSADFDMTANDTLKLVLSTTTAGGQAWREVSRTGI